MKTVKARARIKPGKPVSAAGFVAGIIFVCLGLFVVVPSFGPFGIIWTLVAAVVAVYHGVNLFSRRGPAAQEVEFETKGAFPGSQSTPRIASERLDELDALKRHGRITAEEYETQRKRILDSV